MTSARGPAQGHRLARRSPRPPSLRKVAPTADLETVASVGPVGPVGLRGRFRQLWRQAGPFAVPMFVLGLMQWVGTLASPALFDRAPLLLAFLSPRAPFLLYASASSPLGLFLLVASSRMLVADPLNYCIGRRFGPAVTQRWVRRGGWRARIVQLSERVIDRCGVVGVACRPNAMMLALAGARRLNPWATGTAAVLGTVTYATALAVTADAAADPVGALVARARTLPAPLWNDLSATSPIILALVVAATAAATVAWFATRWRLRLARA